MYLGSDSGSITRNFDNPGRNRRKSSQRKSRAGSRMHAGSMVVPLTKREKKRQ